MQIRVVLMSRIALVAAGFLLLAALAGCASTPSNGFVGDPTPLAVKAIGRSDGKYNRNDEESRSLAGAKGAWRRGDVLTVDTEEGIQYRFIDAGVCEGFYTCRRWIFHGSAQAIGKPSDAHPANYWLIEFGQGEGGYWLAINPADGSSTSLDTKPSVSPDKHYWATGECNEESEDSLRIFEAGDFARLLLVADAGNAPCCELVGWDGPALKVKSCDLEPDKAFEDRLLRQADGRWTGKRIRLQKPKAP